MEEPFRHRLRVRYNECDPQGIVFNANYLTYHDIAVTELWREAFGSWDGFVADHAVEMVNAEARVRYLAPLRFDDEVEIAVVVRHLGNTSVVVGSTMTRDGSPVAEVDIRYVVLDGDMSEKAEIPAVVREVLERYT